MKPALRVFACLYEYQARHCLPFLFTAVLQTFCASYHTRNVVLDYPACRLILCERDQVAKTCTEPRCEYEGMEWEEKVRLGRIGQDSLSSQGERIWESYQSSGCMFWCIIPGICPLSSPSAESISGITLPRISLSRTQNSSQGFPWDVPNK